MMRRCLLATASQATHTPAVAEGFQQLFSSSSAALALAAAAARGELAPAAPLLSRAARQQQAQHAAQSLVPWAAAAATAARPCGGVGALALRQQARGYAQMGTKMPRAGYKPPVEMQRAMQMRLSMVSPNVLAEPYRGVPPKLPLAAYFSVAGWKEVWHRLLSQIKSLYTLARCNSLIPGFSRPAFKAEALDIYKQVCTMLAEGDKTSLRQLVTPAVFSDMKRQLKQREDGGWARVQWDIVQEPGEAQIHMVHGRLIMIDPKDKTSGYAQVTVRIPSQQRFAAYNKSGKLVAGSLEQAIDVEDFWVFEHSLRKSPANRWRLAGRLSILPAAVETTQGQAGAVAAGGAAVQQRQRQAAGSEQDGADTMRVGHVADQQRQTAHPQWGQKAAASAPAARQRQAVAGRGRK